VERTPEQMGRGKKMGARIDRGKPGAAARERGLEGVNTNGLHRRNARPPIIHIILSEKTHREKKGRKKDQEGGERWQKDVKEDLGVGGEPHFVGEISSGGVPYNTASQTNTKAPRETVREGTQSGPGQWQRHDKETRELDFSKKQKTFLLRTCYYSMKIPGLRRKLTGDPGLRNKGREGAM